MIVYCVWHVCAYRYVMQVVNRLTVKLLAPLRVMLRRWVTTGELEDPHHELFIQQDPTVPNEQLWGQRYSIREAMLPSFVPLETAVKLLKVGRSLNFIRVCCGEELHGSEAAAEEALGASLALSVEAVDRLGEGVHKQVMALMIGKYGFHKHITALKGFLLLGHGDFVLCLLDMAGKDLASPAAKVLRHSLASQVSDSSPPLFFFFFLPTLSPFA